MRWALPDLILAECVSEFDTRPLEQFFEESYVFVKCNICPVDLGWPCRRRRFYGAWVRRKTFALDLHADDVPGTFSRVFSRTQQATVNVFYRAPPALMLAHKQVLADKRRLVLEPYELNIIHWKKLIDPGSNQRLRAYVHKLEKSLQKHSKAAPEHLIINMNETVQYAKPHLLGSTSFPTLLRASKLVDIGGGRLRLIHPLEHFCVMGFPLFLSDYDGGGGHFSCLPWPEEFLMGMAAGIAGQLCGNGMHCASLGAWIQFILSVLRQIDQTPAPTV